MFVLKRNQVIITALVIMIGVAGYLTWIDTAPVDGGFAVNAEGDIDALIPDPSIWASLFPEGNYEGLIGGAWVTTHDPSIPVSGLPGLDQIIRLPSDESIPGEAIFVNTSRDSSFFVQARLNREQNRAASREILNDIINNANVATEQRARAADDMLEIQRRIEHETAAESLIESKGFSEVYVRISDNGVDVVVAKETLDDQELAMIMDIIKRKTGMNEAQIFISPIRR